MNILVTGGVGFIGSHLTDALIAQSHQVIILDNLSTGQLSNLNPQATFIQRDINQPLDDIFEQYHFDYVFHLAAQINLRQSIQNPYQCAQDNIMGSINLINYCIKYNVKKFIFSSTGGAIYDPGAPLPWTENSLASPNSPYGWSKLAIEQYLKMARGLYGMNYSVLRYSNCWGVRQNALGEAGIIAIFLDRIAKEQPLKIYGSGEQSRDFVWCGDIISANLAVMNQLVCETYNVSTNTATSVNDIIQMLPELMHTKVDIEYLPAIPGEVLHTKLSYDKLYNATKWKPRYLNLRDGLEEMIGEMKK